MRYPKENDYDGMIEREAYQFGGAFMPYLVKAIIAVESQFEPRCRAGFPPRFGLAGLTAAMANRVAVTGPGGGHEVTLSDLYEPDINIRLAACYLRLLFATLSNANMFDVIRQYGEHAGRSSGDAEGFVKSVWSEYKRFSQSSNAVPHYMPMDSAGKAEVGAGK